jgi:nucleobase:cation symporter-1, NCS1 family
MVSIRSPPNWGSESVPSKDRSLRGRDYFILWSSLGVGLLVFSAGSFLSSASFIDAVLAILVGSIVGSLLLALAGKIGSDHGVPSLVSMRPSFGVHGSYLPAVLNVMQLIGWATFEIMIMSKAAEILVNKLVPFYIWAIIFGVFISLLGIAGPIVLIRQWLGRFAIWIVYASSIIIIITLIISENLQKLLLSPGNGMSFFSALDIVIAMPVSWMPLVADYNRFAKDSKNALKGTLLGFAITNISFYLGGTLLGVSDTLAIITRIQSIFFGFLMMILIVDETDNAFADIYSAVVSSLSISNIVSQRHLIIAFTALSTALATMIPIAQYENFILLIGAVFVPLFGIVLSDYYVLKRCQYTHDMMYGKNSMKIGFTAIISWFIGLIVYYLLSSLSPIHIAQVPPLGATIPSIIVSSLVYIGIRCMNKKFV